MTNTDKSKYSGAPHEIMQQIKAELKEESKSKVTVTDELREGYIKVQLDYAPKTNGKKFNEWCEKHGFTPLASGRRAWCSSLSTYLRDAAGVAFNDGEMVLFYDDDIVDTDKLTQRIALEARIDEWKLAKKDGAMLIGGFPTEHIEGKYVKNRLTQLKKVNTIDKVKE